MHRIQLYLIAAAYTPRLGPIIVWSTITSGSTTSNFVPMQSIITEQPKGDSINAFHPLFKTLSSLPFFSQKNSKSLSWLMHHARTSASLTSSPTLDPLTWIQPPWPLYSSENKAKTHVSWNLWTCYSCPSNCLPGFLIFLRTLIKCHLMGQSFLINIM